MLRETLSQAMDALRRIEPDLDPPLKPGEQAVDTEGSRKHGASIVEILWRQSMQQHRAAEWYELNSRLLIWRGYSGESTGVSEWARKQTVLMIGEQS